MATCRKCGQDLTPGNTRVIRKQGKRTYRVHRHCPKPVGKSKLENQAHSEAAYVEISEPAQVAVMLPAVSEPEPFNTSEPEARVGERRYRFYLQPASMEKLRKALGKSETWLFGFASDWSIGIQLEIIPVLEEIAEANPEVVSRLIEVKIDLEGM